MNSRLPELAGALLTELAAAIEELRGDPQILGLLATSIEINLETLTHVVRYDIPIDEVQTPTATQEYARRLAQRGISPNAVVRAFRLAQQKIVDWAFNEIAKQEPDPRVAFAAGQLFVAITFRFVDRLAEDMLDEYEGERARWVTHRNTLRAAMIQDLVAGENVDIGAAEGALGYRLQQTHLGVVVWTNDQTPSAIDVRRLEHVLVRIGESLGAAGQPLFVPNDRSTGWGWIALGQPTTPSALKKVEEELDHTGIDVQAALGNAAAGIAGFRVTHIEAERAQRVAMLAQGRTSRLISFADPGVRAAAMLHQDLEATRRLVQTSLGALAADTPLAARLRDTLLTFLLEWGSYTATAERVHLHKSTVRYRIEKAIAERGRPIHDERLDLELALIACRWLGSSVLPAKKV